MQLAEAQCPQLLKDAHVHFKLLKQAYLESLLAVFAGDTHRDEAKKLLTPLGKVSVRGRVEACPRPFPAAAWPRVRASRDICRYPPHRQHTVRILRRFPRYSSARCSCWAMRRPFASRPTR